MPAWVDRAVNDYRRRLPPEFALHCHAVPMTRRGKTVTPEQALRREGEALLGQTRERDHVVALTVDGQRLSTEALARRLRRLRDDGLDLALLVGGPDGLDARCRQRADEQWSVSALTLPHPLVRVIIAEQIYRVWSMLASHPYHRA